MPNSVLKEALGLGRSVIEGVRIEGGSTIISARPRRRAPRCPVCGRRCDGYDRLATRRRARPGHRLGPRAVLGAPHAQGRVARAPHARERARRAHARGLAHRGRHLLEGRGVARGGGRARTPRRAQVHRDRRDQLQEGPQVHDGRRRPRPGARTSLRRGGTGRRRRTPSSTCPRRSRGKASRSPSPTAPGGSPTSSPSGSPTPSSPWTHSTSRAGPTTRSTDPGGTRGARRGTGPPPGAAAGAPGGARGRRPTAPSW